MSFRQRMSAVLLGLLMALPSASAWAQQQNVRIVGTVRDETNAIALPGTPVEVVGTNQVVHTDVDGRYVLNLPAGTHQIKVALDGYQEKLIRVETGAERTQTLDIGIVMNRFAESVTVAGQAVDAETSSAAAQLVERRNSDVITDNMGAQEMRQNGDSDAAAALSRVTGMSVVDNQYVFVRGLGERYSNTTLAGAVIPTTEPDKKVVPLDLFPAGLIDSVQIAKSYSPDKSAEFAGGLVQIVPLKLPNRPVVDLSYGISASTTATGKSILVSPLNGRDVWGFDNGARALPSSFPSNKIVRRGIFTPTVGYTPEEITAFGRALENVWRPTTTDGAPGQSWSMSAGNRFGKLGFVASATHSYKEQYIEEERRFFRVESGSGANVKLESTSDYALQTGAQKAQLGIVGNIAYQFTPNQRLGIENFYTHSGRDEGRFFEGDNRDNVLRYQNYRVQFIEEGMISNGITGEHFFQGLANSRFDWRGNFARANRDEPDLREVYYERSLTAAANAPYVLSDESQSGFRMFNTLDDETIDVSANWAMLSNSGGRPMQYKFGVSFVDRTRDFQSRRFRFIPVILTKDGVPLVSNQLAPEQQYASANIGTAFRFNEETRPTDAYDGQQTTTSGYGMVDVAFSARSRLIAGARIERFDQQVNTFDPFGLFVRTLSAENKNTDFFPSVNFVQAMPGNSNLRMSYGATVNRPEFRELAEFEFTDVVGSRAVKGNKDLQRALIHNVDGRWEMFTGTRGVVAASIFYKYFDKPIERVVLASATPLATFQNSDNARNTGLELEFARDLGRHFFVNANYTFVDSKITLLANQLATQTSLVRPLAGQSKNLFNMTFEATAGGFAGRLLYNYFGDRISDVGANDAPDILEQGRGSLDLVLSQKIRSLNVRLTLENLTDSEYRFTQGSESAPQRLFKLGRVVALSFGYNIF
ncbi:MAG TPA: outer membrane beta-barrel protein [Vicinamibacterales bacterium]|nr:outer membrane beta-barrel protein [Vicinamibacterales bacterium]